MSTYGKKKYGCLKYILFAVAIIFAMAYTFTKLAPKASQMAKEEVTERLFGVVPKDTSKAINSDTIPYNKIGGFSNRDIDIAGALSKCFNHNDIEIIYTGIPESRLPIIIEGKLSWFNLNDNLRARNVKFRIKDGAAHNVYVIYDRLTGTVVDVANDERYIINAGRKDSIQIIDYEDRI